jgi:hypothetical protein
MSTITNVVQSVRLAVNLDSSVSSLSGLQDWSPFPVQSSGAGAYAYEYAVVKFCVATPRATHRLVAALWPSRGAVCQFTMPHL